MAHYAYLDENNIVIQTIVGRGEDDLPEGISDWEEYFAAKPGVSDCKRTSYNTRGGVHYNPETGEPSEDQSKAFRANYAGIGYSYDSELDVFIPPQPFASWILDEVSFTWEPPIPMPEDGFMYSWDEDSQQWAQQ